MLETLREKLQIARNSGDIDGAADIHESIYELEQEEIDAKGNINDNLYVYTNTGCPIEIASSL